MSDEARRDGSAGGLDAALACNTEALRRCLEVTLEALDAGAAARGGPGPAGEFGDPAVALAAALGGAATAVSDRGVGSERALRELVALLASGHTDPGYPACVAHLHCPPLAVAAAADLAVCVLNPSLDSWDQGPSAAADEAYLIAELCELAGYRAQRAGGFMTTGATASTVTALFLAREHAIRAGRDDDRARGHAGRAGRDGGRARGHAGRAGRDDGRARGRAGRAGRDGGRAPRVLCSEQAHFSVWRAAELLGFGEDGVVSVATDQSGRLQSDAAREVMNDDPAAQWVVVATAGTTDLGAIDPLVELGELARSFGAWFHVDAAYGGPLLFSRRLRPLLDGIATADSIALDAHKLGWQPVAAGVLLVAQRQALDVLGREVAYLNAADDQAAGLAPLLSSPMTTTRRADAFKLLVTMRALGRDGLGDLVERCFELARVAASAVDDAPELELHSAPTLTTVLFRPQHAVPSERDAWCARVRRTLLHDGSAVVGRTDLPGTGPGRRWLKFTLLNPEATDAQIRSVVGRVVSATRDTAP